MSEEEVASSESEWWRNWLGDQNLSLLFSLFSIGIVIYVIEADLVNENPLLFWVLVVLDLAIVGWFIAEHARSLSLTEDRTVWWRTNGWELIGLTPVILAAIPQIQVILILRLVHLTRVYSSVISLLGLHETSEHSPVHRQIQHLAFVVISLVGAGGFIAYLFEKPAHADCLAKVDCDPGNIIHTIPEAMWWAVTTATTVGYGDYYPVTTGGRVVSVLLMLVGIGIFGLLAATLSQLLWARGRRNGTIITSDADPEEIIDRLERLADMRRDGWLTGPEFHDAKASVLTGRMPGSTRSRDIESRPPIPRDERRERRDAARSGFILDGENEE
jgi:voltage-gated potassium channel